MTDMPERIAFRKKYMSHAITNGPLMDHPDYIHYTRADHVDALLKAEREKALREAAAWAKSEGLFRTSREILALISKDKTDG